MELSNNSTVKTPEAETETPTRIQAAAKTSPPFSNGVLKRHAPLNLHRHHHPVVVAYKECLKNHAASLGGHAVDGCGEFMPSPATNPADPTSLKCAACGCHRNFHRREPEDPLALLPAPPNAVPALEYRPHHRHHPPPPPRGGSPSNSPSPPPISSSYYPSAPQMLLALSHGLAVPQPESHTPISACGGAHLSNSGSRKRFRTKFTQDQKDRMLEFAEKVGWKMQKREEDSISEFCTEIGVDKGVFKVWMHNNKNTFTKKDGNQQPNLSNAAQDTSTPPAAASNGGGINFGAAAEERYHRNHRREEEEEEEEEINDDSKENAGGGQDQLNHHHNSHRDNSSSAHILGTNGSSSS